MPSFKPEVLARATRRYRLKTLYGLTEEQYDDMLEAQGGGCALCGTENGRSDRIQRLTVDHDDYTLEVRGLLCSPCNLGIGQLGHDPQRLRRAADYLDRKATK